MRSVDDRPGGLSRDILPAGPLPRHARRFCTSRPTLEQPGVSSRIGHRQKRPSAVQLDRCLRAQISPGYARHMHAAVHMHHKDSIMSVSSDPRPGITPQSSLKQHPDGAMSALEKVQNHQAHGTSEPASFQVIHPVLLGHLGAVGNLISQTWRPTKVCEYETLGTMLLKVNKPSNLPEHVQTHHID